MASTELVQQGLDRRREIFTYIKDYIRQYGYGPSLTEIADHVGPLSRSTVRYHLVALAKQGLVTTEPGKYRSLRVPDGRRVPS
jgi:repressor LexA